MRKTLISMLVVVLILFFATMYERGFVNRQFEEFDQVVAVVYEKVNDKTATEDDLDALKENWLDKKRVLHIFIPHNEIKEMELWISESILLVRDEKWSDALSKVRVIKELSKEIPKTFALSPENIL